MYFMPLSKIADRIELNAKVSSTDFQGKQVRTLEEFIY